MLYAIPLGGLASIAFVFLLANTDRSDNARLLGIALLSGFFWEPVLEASRALIDQRIEEKNAEVAENSLHAFADLAARYENAPPEEKTILVGRASGYLSEFGKASEGIKNSANLRTIQNAVWSINNNDALPPELRATFEKDVMKKWSQKYYTDFGIELDAAIPGIGMRMQDAPFFGANPLDGEADRKKIERAYKGVIRQALEKKYRQFDGDAPAEAEEAAETEPQSDDEAPMEAEIRLNDEVPREVEMQ